jgi:hypothetical protein
MSTSIAPEVFYRQPHKIDWLDDHRKKIEMGAIGEGLVLELEKKYLNAIGNHDLAARVKKAENNWDGYDILSFFADGSEKYIEVKSTEASLDRPYFLSKGELVFLADNRDRAFVYRVKIGNSENKESARLIVYSFSEVIHASVMPTNFKVDHAPESDEPK